MRGRGNERGMIKARTVMRKEGRWKKREGYDRPWMNKYDGRGRKKDEEEGILSKGK